MSDEQRADLGAPDRWRSLPPRTPLEDLETGQQVAPTPQAIAEAPFTPMDEAVRYPI